MTWLAWRQFRASAGAAVAGLAVLVVAFALTGPGLADDYSESLAGCTQPRRGPADTGCMVLAQDFVGDHQNAFLAVTGLVLALPAVVGLFWGAPLVAREVEAGTHRVAWNQSITRTRWLAVKLGIGGLAAVAVAGVGSLAVTWWSSPLDRAAATDLSRMEPLLFAARGIVPIGYAAVAFTLGVAVGMVVTRTLPAMAVTLAAFVVLQVAVPVLVRPHLIEPAREAVEISDSNTEGFKLSRVGPDRVLLDPGDTGAWFLSADTVDASGNVVDAMGVSRSGPCVSEQQDREQCLAEMRGLGYSLQVTYHPADRFWPLQWREGGVYAALALALAGFCLRRIRHDLA